MMLTKPVSHAVRQAVWAATLAVGLLAFAGCEDAPPVKIPDIAVVDQLTVVTPHDEMIRSAFSNAFSDWHKERYGTYVQIRWVAAGTPQCVQYVQEAGRPEYVPAGRSIPDVLFGGSSVDHQLIADAGLSIPVDLTTEESTLPAAVGGTATRDAENRWHSSALSSFGILVAEKACAQRDIAAPTSWEDMAATRFFGWTSIADPERSGSNRQCLLLILQKYGWDEGWGIIMRLAGNSRALVDGSADVIGDVAAGSALAGFCVNFSGLRQVEQCGEGRLGFVVPADAYAVTPDPISVLTYALHPEIGKHFASFCVSDAGQKLWGFRAEYRDSKNDTLFRYPIKPGFYVEHKAELSVTDNPFEMPSLLGWDDELEQKRSTVVGPMLLAACGDNHVALQRCWRELIDAGLPEAALAELLKPIVSEDEAYKAGIRYRAGGDEAKTLFDEWSKKFAEKYAQVEGMLGGA